MLTSVLLLFLFGVIIMPVNVVTSDTADVKLNATITTGTTTGHEQIDLGSPADLMDFGEGGDFSNHTIETLPDGRSLSVYVVKIFNVPVWGSEATVQEDPSKPVLWSFSNAEDTKYDKLEEKVATLFQKITSNDTTISQARCARRWKLKEGRNVHILAKAQRFIYPNKNTGTVTFADEIVVWNYMNLLQVYYCLIDAVNQTFIRTYPNFKEAPVNGMIPTNITLFGGNRQTGRRQFNVELVKSSDDSGRCFLTNPSGTVRLYDANHIEIAEHGEEIMTFNCIEGPQNDAINEGYGVAADCYNYIMETRRCITLHTNFTDFTSLFENTGGRFDMVIHYGVDLDYAGWASVHAVYGDGKLANGDRYPTCSSIDVVSHEFAHAITEHFSGLLYREPNGSPTEVSCVDESFSDMTAMMTRVCVEGSTDWLVMRGWVKNPGEAEQKGLVRNMKKAVSDSAQMKRYSEYKPGEESHNCSGIFNNAFYLLSTSSNWDIFKAYRMFFGANRFQWTGKTTMPEIACGVVTYANDIKLSTQEIRQIIDVFATVGIAIKECAAMASINMRPIVTTTPAPTTITTTRGGRVTTRRGSTTPSTTTTTTEATEEESHIPVYTIRNCQNYNGISGKKDSSVIYNLTSPVKKTRQANRLLVTLRPPEGGEAASSADIFIKYGVVPTSVFDTDIQSHTEDGVITIVMTCQPSGSYYILLYGYEDYSNMELNACYLYDANMDCTNAS